MNNIKNDFNLNIKNVICFYVADNAPDNINIVKKKKQSDWNYQDYLTAACDKHKYKLIFLNKYKVSFSIIDSDTLVINDGNSDNTFSLNKSNINDTIIFQGQANDSILNNYICLMQTLEKFGFYVINTIDTIITASDKYVSSNLLSAYNISQPKYFYINKDLFFTPSNNGFEFVSDLFYNNLNNLKSHNINNNIDTTKFVLKILNGSLGIGVMLVKENEIVSILQTLFKIDSDSEFIIQEYKENTGDIRIHVFSVDGYKYEILGVMKRDKISGDFRSNVSLGATTESYELTEKQKKLAIDTARASGCNWVGVDMMSCVDGDFIIEFNSSPGVQGISQQMKNNMFEVVFEKINKYIENSNKTDDKNLSYKENNIGYPCVTYTPGYIMNIIDKCKDIFKDENNIRYKIIKECINITPGNYYELGGKDDLYHGLDCSGYIKYVYNKAGIKNIPDLCAKYFDSDNLSQISKEELMIGDLGVKNDVLLHNHCGIYCGTYKELDKSGNEVQFTLWFECNARYGCSLIKCTNDKFKYFFRHKMLENNKK